MSMETLGWIVGGWFVVAFIISLAVGGFMRAVNEGADDSELAQMASQRRVVRYLRGRKADAASQAPVTRAANREKPRRTSR